MLLASALLIKLMSEKEKDPQEGAQGARCCPERKASPDCCINITNMCDCPFISEFLNWRLTFSKCDFPQSITFCLTEAVDRFQGKQNKMTALLYDHTEHTTTSEKWQHFSCIQSHVPECPSVVVNYEWAIKFLSTLNVFHFLIMRHRGILSSEIRFLISKMKCAKFYTVSLPRCMGL